MGTVTYQGAGASASGTTSATPDYPSSSGAGSLLLAVVGGKAYSSQQTVGNFAPLCAAHDGRTASGDDTGSTRGGIFVREPTGSVSGTETVSSAAGRPVIAQILRFTRDTPYWDLLGIAGADVDITGTTVSATGSVWASSVGNSFTLACLAYGGGTWVGCATTSGTPYTSTDGITWTARTNPAGTVPMQGVAYDASTDTWVAAGNSGHIIYSTDDGATWTDVATGSAANLQAVATDGAGTWVTVGSSGAVLTSTSPSSSWSAASSPGFGSNTIRGVAHYSGTWVGVAATGIVRTATTPSGTWSAASGSPISAANLYRIAHGGSYWVATGASGSIFIATDPTGTWTAASSPGFTSGDVIQGLAYGAGTWVAVGGTSKVYATTDPTGTWSEVTSPSPTSQTFYAAASDGERFVVTAVGTQALTLDPLATAPDITAGDLLVIGVSSPGDTNTHSAQALSVAGCTLGTVTWLSAVTSTASNDGALHIGYCTVTSGTATGWPVYTATAATSGQSGTSLTVARVRASLGETHTTTGTVGAAAGATGSTSSTRTTTASVGATAGVSATDTTTRTTTGTAAAVANATAVTEGDSGAVTAGTAPATATATATAATVRVTTGTARATATTSSTSTTERPSAGSAAAAAAATTTGVSTVRTTAGTARALAGATCVAYRPSDVTLALGPPRRHPLSVGPPRGHGLSAGAGRRHPLSIGTPRRDP